ncbi:MAG: hypothetical protein AAFU86_04635 [Pseudomonadota bacterium]
MLSGFGLRFQTRNTARTPAPTPAKRPKRRIWSVQLYDVSQHFDQFVSCHIYRFAVDRYLAVVFHDNLGLTAGQSDAVTRADIQFLANGYAVVAADIGMFVLCDFLVVVCADGFNLVISPT